MYCKNVLFFWLAVLLVMFGTNIEGRNKKVVIHVPYKVKKVNHVHTIFKTIHHHHTHREPHYDFSLSPLEEHEHFHHLQIHEDAPVGQHSQPMPEMKIPEFLPDAALDVPLKIPDIPHGLPTLPLRQNIPLYRRN